MLSIIKSMAIMGINGELVSVQVDVSSGLPYFEIVGLPDTTVRESKERVRVSIKNSGYDFFSKRIIVNLAPANTKNTDPEYPNNFAKIRDSRTAFIETSARSLKINHGAYIDIFPLDNYPRGFKAKIYEIRKTLLTWRINTVFYLPNKSLKSKLLTAVTCILYPSVKKAIEKREKLFKSVSESGLVVNNSGAWLEKEIIPAEWVKGSIEMEFEGIKVRVSDKYDEWLTFVYGDYMSPPPESERVGHHYTDIFDMDRSYTEYIN